MYIQNWSLAFHHCLIKINFSRTEQQQQKKFLEQSAEFQE
jgi:hypothetical protein